MSEKQEKVSVSVRMPAELYEALKILALAEERSLSKQIIHAINEWMQAGKDEDEGDGVTVDASSGDVTISRDELQKFGGWDAEIPGQVGPGREVTGVITGYTSEAEPFAGYSLHEISFRVHEPIQFTPSSLLQSSIKFIPKEKKK